MVQALICHEPAPLDFGHVWKGRGFPLGGMCSEKSAQRPSISSPVWKCNSDNFFWPIGQQGKTWIPPRVRRCVEREYDGILTHGNFVLCYQMCLEEYFRGMLHRRNLRNFFFISSLFSDILFGYISGHKRKKHLVTGSQYLNSLRWWISVFGCVVEFYKGYFIFFVRSSL